MINEYGHYEELAALASGGYLSEDELSDLQAHSETCADCRNALAEFHELVHFGLPLTESRLHQIVSTTMSRPDRGAPERFLQRASMEGITFSPGVKKLNSSPRWRLSFAAPAVYDLGYGGGVSGTMINFPYDASHLISGPIPFDFTNPAFQHPPFTLVPGIGTVYISAVDPHLQVPFTYEWNVAVQRGFGANQSVSATYVGAHGTNLLREGPVIYPNANYDTSATHNGDWSNYNALQFQFQRRMARGFQALVSYTFSKSTDTASDDTDAGIWTTSLSNVKVASDLSLTVRRARFVRRGDFLADTLAALEQAERRSSAELADRQHRPN
jgi:hypothetical protein